MKIAVAGSSGLVGRAVARALRQRGDEVVRLVRHPVENPDEVFWDPSMGKLEPSTLEELDAVINLAGESIAAGRWTSGRRLAIRRSRVDATRTLVAALRAARRRPSAFVSASAVGYYGSRGDETLAEDAPAGRGFMPEVCLAWEGEAAGVEQLGMRRVTLRFGMVLAPGGGALAKMLPAFRWGLGGRLGTGRQWMSWVSLPDAVGVVLRALDDASCSGALNVVAPEPVTNAEFAAILARVLKRPAAMMVPAGVLRLLWGELADAVLLASVRAVPARLAGAGYLFQHGRLEESLRATIGRGA